MAKTAPTETVVTSVADGTEVARYITEQTTNQTEAGHRVYSALNCKGFDWCQKIYNSNPAMYPEYNVKGLDDWNNLIRAKIGVPEECLGSVGKISDFKVTFGGVEMVPMTTEQKKATKLAKTSEPVAPIPQMVNAVPMQVAPQAQPVMPVAQPQVAPTVPQVAPMVAMEPPMVKADTVDKDSQNIMKVISAFKQGYDKTVIQAQLKSTLGEVKAVEVWNKSVQIYKKSLEAVQHQ